MAEPILIKTFGFLAKPAAWVMSRLADRIFIKEIKTKNDRDIENTLDLYERLFKDEHRVAGADLIAWLGQSEDRKLYTVQHCLLIAKHKGKPVGILKVLYSHFEKYGLICYFGIDKENVASRLVASKLLMRFFKRYLNKRWKDCDGLALEVEIPEPEMTKEEVAERTARIRRFREIAHRHSYDLCRITFEYIQPKMADTFKNPGKEKQMGLMLIPIKKCESACICRQDFERLLKFLIYGVYGNTQRIAPENKQDYDNYLDGLYELLTRNAKDKLRLDR